MCGIGAQVVHVPAGPRFRHQPGQLAVHVRQRGQQRHVCTPGAEAGIGDRRLGRMVDHDGQLRISAGAMQQRGQVAWQHQRVQPQAVFHHGVQGWRQRGIRNPLIVVDILQHGPQAFELAVRCQASNLRRCIRRQQIGPAHDGANEAGLCRQRQQVIGISN
ncbi:hypothetical protein D3C81_1755250 [compost metagenome]